MSHSDASQVVAVDAGSGQTVWKANVGQAPRYLQVVDLEGRPALLVSCARSGEIWLLDALTGQVQDRLRVGPSPQGFDVVEGRFLVVALQALHQVAVWDLATRKQAALLSVPHFPTAVRASPAAGALYIGHFFQGSISVLDAKTFKPGPSLTGAPEINQVSALLTADRGRTLIVPHILSNTGQTHLHVANAISPAISIVDTGRRTFQTLQLALIDRPVNGPEAVALLPGRQALISVNSRSNDLSILDWSTRLASAHVEVGRYPSGIAFNSRETRAFVANAHEQTISVIDLGRNREVGRWRFGSEVLPKNLARGRDLFHDADSRRLSLNQWISCSNCHPGGHSDGRVWQLPGKPRLRTKDLHGLASTLPAGWLASQDEMQDEEIFIREFHRGSGLSAQAPNPKLGKPNAGLSEDLDALSEYVYSLRFEPSPYLVGRKLSPAAERGKKLFFAPALGCAGCHPPPTYTVSSPKANPRYSNLLSPSPSSLPALDVPSLLGLFRQPRLLHDGRAERVADVFQHWNQEDRHGRTRALKRRDLEDLEAFLLSLPY